MADRSDFWSRRKAAVRAEAESETLRQREQEEAEERRRLEERPDEEILAELNLPDPDTLEKGDDFSLFMKSAVPERIRRRALRRLWRSNPVLANLDGLVDYGEDYTDAATVVENLSTVYQVGKGMLAQFGPDHEDEAPEEALAEARGEQEDEAATDTPEVHELEDSNPVAIEAHMDQNDAAAETEPECLRPAAKRRMRFSFEDS
ncbi:MAG: DUF3306 domain-containing protein [Rhodobacteraceae bacterium]|nr:DUF3306 domain-containing protein [Paracoccaceae bacterium]